jgi:hypothetical protein
LLSRLALVAGISAMLCLLGTIWHAHYVFDLRAQTEGAAYNPTRLEIGLIMACTFYIVPIASAAGGIWLADRLRTLQLPARARTPKSDKPSDAPKSRNAPCPCGSGRKYKRCCGAKQE